MSVSLNIDLHLSSNKGIETDSVTELRVCLIGITSQGVSLVPLSFLINQIFQLFLKESKILQN